MHVLNLFQILSTVQQNCLLAIICEESGTVTHPNIWKQHTISLSIHAKSTNRIFYCVWFGLVWFGFMAHQPSSIPNQFLYKQTVLFQTIQFCISTQFSSICPIDRTLSGATTLDQSGPGSNGNKEVHHTLQNSSITGASPSDRFVSYQKHSLGESYPSVQMQSVYSKAVV